MGFCKKSKNFIHFHILSCFDGTVSRDSNNLLILVYREVSLDPLKKGIAHLLVHHGVADSIAVSRAEIVAWLHGVLIPPPLQLKIKFCISSSFNFFIA